VAYSQAVSATDADASPTVAYSVNSSTLPAGITFSAGTFSGTPTANSGSYSASIRATDLGGNYVDRTFTLAQAKPDAPTIGTATQTGATTATVPFTAPAYTGTSAITTYTATSSPAGGTGTLSQAGSGTITVSGLTTNTAYTFTVTATNSSGASLASAASNSVTPLVVGSYESIQTFAVGSGGSASISFTSIPATYKHLQIRANIRGTVSAANVDVLMRFNGDTGNMYTGTQVYGDGTGGINQNGLGGGVAGTNAYPFYTIGDTGQSNVFGPGILDIIDYADTGKYKVWKSLEGFDQNGAGGHILLRAGSYISLNAISSISLTPDSGSFKENTHFALYGIKG
jgi:hypothetical protein